MTFDPAPPEPAPAPAATAPARAVTADAVPRGPAALAGVVAAALALATGELVAAFVPGAASPLVAVGSAVIDLSPPGSKDFVVSLFGTNDKLALLVVVGAAVLAFGALIGLLARRSVVAGGAAIVLLTGVGALAGLRDPASSTMAVLASWAAQGIVGYIALTELLERAKPRSTEAASASRRRFLAWAGGLGVLAVVGGGIGRSM